MSDQTKIALDCPWCGASIYQLPSWFKKAYSTCPACDQPIPAEKFDTLLHELEQGFDATIDALLSDEQPTSGGCCGSKKTDGCCGRH